MMPDCSSVGVIDEEVGELVEFDDTVSIAIELIEQSREVPSINTHLQAHEKGLQLIGRQNTVFIQVELTESVSENHFFGLAAREVKELCAHSLGKMLDLLLRDGCSLIFANLPN